MITYEDYMNDTKKMPSLSVTKRPLTRPAKSEGVEDVLKEPQD